MPARLKTKVLAMGSLLGIVKFLPVTRMATQTLMLVVTRRIQGIAMGTLMRHSPGMPTSLRGMKTSLRGMKTSLQEMMGEARRSAQTWYVAPRAVRPAAVVVAAISNAMLAPIAFSVASPMLPV
jgi:hypothetical protein